MKSLAIICFISLASSANAQYFKGRHIYTKTDTTTLNLLTRYANLHWVRLTVTSQSEIVSPIIIRPQKSNYQHLGKIGISIPSMDRINRYLTEKNWQDMNLQPLVHLLYSIHNPEYTPRD